MEEKQSRISALLDRLVGVDDALAAARNEYDAAVATRAETAEQIKVEEQRSEAADRRLAQFNNERSVVLDELNRVIQDVHESRDKRDRLMSRLSEVSGEVM